MAGKTTIKTTTKAPGELTTKSLEAKPRKTVKKKVLNEIELSAPQPEKKLVSPRRRSTYATILMVGIMLEALLLGIAFYQIQSLTKSQTLIPTTGTTAQNAPGDIDGTIVKVDNGTLPVLGNPNAKVTMIEFADFRCPYCERFYTDTLSKIKKAYIDTGKVKLYFRNYAFLGPASEVAANASACANEQGKFWNMYNYFYENQPNESDTSMYTTDTLTQVAGTLHMDTKKFTSCLHANKYNKNVQTDFNAGNTAGVNGTPTIFIDGVAVVGAKPYDSFKQVIDAELKKHTGFLNLF